jgi:hypothetical protein
MVKDIDPMTEKLSLFCNCDQNNKSEHPAAFIVVLMLLGVFLRNIHGSARYDDYVQEHKCGSRIERNVGGRIFVWLLCILALFLGPSLAGRRLAHGFELTASAERLIVVLFFSLFVYLVWDFTLWFFPIEQVRENGKVERHLEDVVRNWVKIDALAILLGMAFTAYWLFVQDWGDGSKRIYVAWSFVTIASMMLATDYYKNRHFYFPPRS